MNTFPKLSDYPSYVAAEGKLTDLKTELASAQAKRETPPVNRVSDRDAAALARLDGQSPAAQANTTALDAEIATLSRAVELQRQRVEAVECELGRQIGESLKPDLAAIYKKGAKAVTALRDFLTAEAEFCNQLRD